MASWRISSQTKYLFTYYIAADKYPGELIGGATRRWAVASDVKRSTR